MTRPPHTLRRALGLRVAAFCAAVVGGSCGPATGPAVDPIAPVTAQVGVELRLPLHATVAGGEPTFDFSAPDLPDLRRRKLPATLTTYARGEALFRWLPLASDVGAHEVDFRVSGNGVASVVPALITVGPGPDDVPVFRQPVGEGTTLDLARTPCAAIDVIVDDLDQPEVALSLADPAVDNASLAQTGPRAASVRFCPSPAQLARSTIFVLTLLADDGAHQATKSYTVVARSAGACATTAPAIRTTQHADQTTTSALRVSATILDDVGVATAHILWTTTAPHDPQHPDPRTFAPVEMNLTSGDARAGSYEGAIPNPVVSSRSGTTATVYYLVEATDADPGCPHDIVSPVSGVEHFVVTRP